jgi:multiple sugar transport system permease protein
LAPAGAHGGRPPAGRRRKRLRSRLEPLAYLSPTLAVMGVLMAVPIAMVIGFSFLSNVVMEKNPVFVGFSNYIKLFSDAVFWESAWNTLQFTVACVAFHLLLGLAFAQMLNNRLIPKLMTAVFRVIYILPWVFTAAIVVILWRVIMNPNGVANFILESLSLIQSKVEWFSDKDIALGSLTFINIWAGYPFFMISLLAGLQGISPDLYEAASIDGAGPVKRFLHITIPQLRPIIVSMAMLDFIWNVQQFALVFMITGGGPVHATETLGTYTYKLAFGKYEFSMAATSGVVLFLLSMAVAFFYVRSQKARD